MFRHSIGLLVVVVVAVVVVVNALRWNQLDPSRSAELGQRAKSRLGGSHYERTDARPTPLCKLAVLANLPTPRSLLGSLQAECSVASRRRDQKGARPNPKQ